MGVKYSAIKQLIELWDSYEEETNRQDLPEFAGWLTGRLKEKPELNATPVTRKIKIEEPENTALFKLMKEPNRLLEYISRIGRLHDFYIRKFFTDLPIKNRLEYLFLYTVCVKEKARKTELINAHLVDYTTGMDTIKRLVNSKLLEETADEADKRAKLLVLTEEGLRVFELAQKKISEEIQMFLASISTNKWKKSLPYLEEINDFHSNIYLAHSEKTPAELMNLMGSLKHLYK